MAQSTRTIHSTASAPTTRQEKPRVWHPGPTPPMRSGQAGRQIRTLLSQRGQAVGTSLPDRRLGAEVGCGARGWSIATPPSTDPSHSRRRPLRDETMTTTAARTTEYPVQEDEIRKKEARLLIRCIWRRRHLRAQLRRLPGPWAPSIPKRLATAIQSLPPTVANTGRFLGGAGQCCSRRKLTESCGFASRPPKPTNCKARGYQGSAIRSTGLDSPAPRSTSAGLTRLCPKGLSLPLDWLPSYSK